MLVNSNPATIMTDPEMADQTYVEPLTVPVVERIIAHERPDAILSTVGGQTGLNTAVELAEAGVLDEYGIKLIGASLEAMQLAEDRQLFKDAMTRIGLKTPASLVVNKPQDALQLAEQVGYPLLIRPSFTLGGSGSGVAYNREEMEVIAGAGLEASMISEIIIEESLIGWKEYELEVMRDFKDNVVIICSI